MGNGPTVELTIQAGGHIETYTVQTANRTPGDLIGALAKVTGAAFGAHRAEARAVSDMIGNVLHLLGWTPPGPLNAHGLADCPKSSTCPWHSDVAPPHGYIDCADNATCSWHRDRSPRLGAVRALVVELLSGLPGDELRRIIDLAAEWPAVHPDAVAHNRSIQLLRERTLDGRNFRLIEVNLAGEPLTGGGRAHGWASCPELARCEWHRGLPAPFDGLRPWPDPANPSGQRGHVDGLGCDTDPCEANHFTLPEPPF